MKRAVLSIAIVATAMVLGANVYTSVVDAPNWGANPPQGFEAARQYMRVRDPGDFFRIFSPASQVALLAAAIMCWPLRHVRWLAVAALVAGVAADAMTFAYFYPRNDIMFVNPLDVGAATRAWSEWSAMNHVRSALVLTAVLLLLRTLSRVERVPR
jgi:uncharacterized membrane protein